jgi:hypothetical protein
MNRRRFLKSSLLWIPVAPAIIRAGVIPTQRHIATPLIASASSYLLSENFEDATVGYDNNNTNGWASSTDTPNPKYTPALVGTQSFNADWSGVPVRGAKASIASSLDFWVYFTCKITLGTEQVGLFSLLNGSTVEATLYVFGTNAQWFVNNNSSNLGGWVSGTQYFVWWHYSSNGTSAAVSDVYISTSSTKPALSFTFTDNAKFLAINAIKIGGLNDFITGNGVFDWVRVSSSTIGSNPT